MNASRFLLCASLLAHGACREQGARPSTPESQRELARTSRPILKESPATPADKSVFIAPESTLREEAGETQAAVKILAIAKMLRDSVVETAYQGRTVVKPSRGYYAWDCSGMSSWILKRSAPTALRALEKSRPVARDYFKSIEGAPSKRDRRGWRKLAHVSDARPGDLFAWLRSPISKSRVSGHVGFFVTAPTPHPDAPNVYTARIMDATSLPHGNDTRAQEGEGGFGFGTMLFATDASGKTIGYGWHGERSLLWGFMPAEVIYGRVTR